LNQWEKKFNPYLHEVMLKQKSAGDEDMVLEELQKGCYFLLDMMIITSLK
jgi:molecular chaperone GrpE (heat shock protein)